MITKGLYSMLKKPRMLAFFFGVLTLGGGVMHPQQVLALKPSAAPSGEEAVVIEPAFKTLQWNANVLVITGDYNDPLAESQLSLLRTRLTEIREHDIAVLRFARDNISELSEFSNFQYRGWYEMNANQQRYVESLIKADNNVFSVVLVGKDGGIKRVWTPLPEAPQTVPINEIFSIIDDVSTETHSETTKPNFKNR